MITDVQKHSRYLSSLQRLRAQAYLEDGAIHQHQIDPYGRFLMHEDENCWHFLLIDKTDDVIGCLRYFAHSPTATFEDLGVGQSPLAKDAIWGSRLRESVEADLRWLRKRNLGFVEVGGWTLHPEYRHTRAALELVLASFAWSHLVGVGIGCATATVRNNSSGILRRIGGTAYESEGVPFPAYHDSSYGCSMEVLRFHFSSFDPRFHKIVEAIRLRVVEQSAVIQSANSCEDAWEQLRTAKSVQALQRALQGAGVTTTFSAAESSLITA